MKRQDLQEKIYPTPKLNGYRAWHRNTWLLIASNTLTAQAVLLYQFLIDQADFDKKHRTFGMVEVNFKLIGQIFHKKSPNTSKSWFDELLKIGFIKKTKRRDWYELSQFSRYITPGFWQGKAADFAKKENNQSIEEITQIIASETQFNEPKFQSIEEMVTILTQDDSSRALGSSKDQSGLSKQTFGEEDKEWISKNIK
jgi:hypothetical protein